MHANPRGSIALTVALATALAACSQAVSSTPTPAPTVATPASASPAAPAAVAPSASLAPSPEPISTRDASSDLQLVRQVVKDPQINNIDAYSVLIPTGWSFTGKVEWRHDLANLAASILTVEDPATGAAIETFWPVQYDYATPLLMPVGSNWLGAIVKAPMSAKDYVAKVVLPQYRPGAKVVQVDSLPHVADAWRAVEPKLAGDTVSVGSVRVRISTKRGSVPFDEDFYVTVVSHSINGIVQWGPRNLYAFRAPAGKLDAITPLLESIASSGQVTPLWSANYQIVYALFVNGQYAAIRAAGELSRHLAQNAAEISDSLMSGYEAQQAAEDRVFDSYSEYIRGVDRYDVPDVGLVSLPSSYSVCGAGSASVVLVPLLGSCPDDTVLIQPAH
jgi:hypothetical protein